MRAALRFQQLFSDVLARQVEYSYGEAEDSITTMVPLKQDRVGQLVELAKMIPFAGSWAWSVERFAAAIQPDQFLFRLDWLQGEPMAVTCYCRFPSEPATAEFRRAIGLARPFRWNGPDPSAVAASLGVTGPRGIAFRANHRGNLRTAVYFKSEHHVGASWTERLGALLEVCQYPAALAPIIEGHLKELYRPGPAGVVGVDDGEDGVPSAVKFDPSNVPLSAVFGFLARMSVPHRRIEALKKIAIGLRAESVTYAGVQYGREGFSGFRLYLACEPPHARHPGRPTLDAQRTLRPARRLPHY